MLHIIAQQLIIVNFVFYSLLDVDFVLRPLLLMNRDGIEKSRKCPGESDSAGNKRARLDRRNRNDRDRRRNETEEEKKLRLAKRRERASSEKKKKKLLNL